MKRAFHFGWISAHWQKAARLEGTGVISSTAFSIATKVLQAIASFATIHKLVQLWGLSGYGLWATLTVFALYISLFDMGVGYGIKNRVAEAWARGNPVEAADSVRIGVAVYVTASILALAGGSCIVLFVAPFKDHVPAAAILWAACVISFFLSRHNMVLQGLGRFKALALITLIAPLTWFTALQLWPKELALSLEQGAVIYAFAIILQAAVMALVSRRVQTFDVSAWHRTRLHEFKPLMSTGAQFLALQLAAFALNGSGSFLVYRALGGVETAQYDAASKVFSIFMVAFSTLITVAWTEISKAKAAQSQARLLGIYRLLHIAVAITFLLAVIAGYWSAPLTKTLTGITVPSASAAAFVLFIGIQMLAFTSAVFLNAFERLRAQIIAALASIPIFFAVALWLLAHGWGMPSIPMASSTAMLPSLLACYVIARRLIAAQAKRDHGPIPVVNSVAR